MRRRICLALAVAVAAGSSGCSSFDRDSTAASLAAPAGLTRVSVKTRSFVLTAYRRGGERNQPTTVYIEGDGLAWLSRTQVSLDPTPRNPLGLALAAQDPAANVIYIARPCQYTPRDQNPRCQAAYWTDKRFAEEVIASVDEAIDQLAGNRATPSINLVGYSGGGAVAVLVAARRRDVASIRTVAGNLDHEAVNRYHEVDRMPGSLNAIDRASAVAAIPQIHYSGSDDKVVPPFVAEGFRKAVGDACVKTRVIAGATHDKGWIERWRSLLSETPRCE